MSYSNHTYVIMWDEEDILDLVDYTAHEQQHMLMLLSDDPKANHTGNPVRAMIIDAVLDTRSSREVWQFDSELTAIQICDGWEEDSESIKNEIREVGELVYDTHGKKIKC